MKRFVLSKKMFIGGHKECIVDDCFLLEEVLNDFVHFRLKVFFHLKLLNAEMSF